MISVAGLNEFRIEPSDYNEITAHHIANGCTWEATYFCDPENARHGGASLANVVDDVLLHQRRCEA